MKFLLPILLVALNLNLGLTQPCIFDKVNQKKGFIKLASEDTAIRESNVNRNERLIYYIPIVFHIIHNNGDENISDEIVFSQIDALNETFGGIISGANSEDAEIRFCLPTLTPEGLTTNGINRVVSTETDMTTEEEMRVKNLIRWDTRKYLNVWVVKSIDYNPSTNQRVLGYAYLPNGAVGEEFDGIVIDASAVGRPSNITIDTKFLGHTLTHEVGHYLNLFHTWGQNSGTCRDDDGVGDTPPCEGEFYSKYNVLTRNCNVPFQCNSFRMIENYMDYSEDRCSNTFTNGQVIRMRDALESLRPELIDPLNIINTGCFEEYVDENNGRQPNKIRIYPNPTNGIINIFPELNTDLFSTVSVYNVIGEIVYHFNQTLSKKSLTEFNINHLHKGIYIITIHNESFKHQERIVLN